ncbi:N-6 DNA methylase [Immundisolibacter sp.]|uniref:N-6 DNA methylase n=1 Tax=Immundisolibacter sp. TaxID=1934948 RepID=UPI003567633B
MNMLLHGIGRQDYEPIEVKDALAADPGDRFDLVLTNPPFGKKSSTTIVGVVAPAIHGSRDISASMHVRGKVSKERDSVERADFWTTTSNKQLNFIQHVKTILRQNGRAAVVVPDNALFFDKKPASETPWTKKLWIYDPAHQHPLHAQDRPLEARRPG